MKLKLLLAPLAFLLFISCDEGTQTINIDGRYRIDLPSFLTEDKELHDDATLEYANTFREFYIIILEESKENVHNSFEENELEYTTDLKGYTDLLVDNMKQSSSITTASALKPTKINGLDAIVTDASGVVDKIPVYWQLGFVEGKDTYYQTVVWTLEDKKEDNQEKMAQIISTFKETDKTKKRP